MNLTHLILICILATLIGANTTYYLQTQHVPKQQNILDKESLRLLTQIMHLAQDIRIVTYPNGCDKLSQQILGEECDVGNYMEWAGPQLEHDLLELAETLHSVH